MPLTFPPFDLTRLLRTVFDPAPGERIGVLIDLPDPREVRDLAFLQDMDRKVQRKAYEVIVRGLREKTMADLGLTGGDLFAYRTTGGSNLDLPDEAWTPDGRQVSLERDVYPAYHLVLAITDYSATAPLTASAKLHGFRGATLHGLNDIILGTGLAVDYVEVSAQAETLRLALTRADWFEIDYEVLGRKLTLRLVIDGQEAQKSHGLCRERKPDVANLPAGEVYFVPPGAEGQFPLPYEDGTIGIMTVAGGRIVDAEFLSGDPATVEAHKARLAADPVTGEIGELGFGTQELPWAWHDIQDEKILGTVHVATGRSDHLGGALTPDKFTDRGHATHDDILFAPHKTPDIAVPEVRMRRDGQTVVTHANYQPAPYLLQALGRPAAH